MITLKPKINSRAFDFYWTNGAHIGYAYIEVDGYYTFMFAHHRNGNWDAHVLRAIADKLDELNKDWDEEVKQVM